MQSDARQIAALVPMVVLLAALGFTVNPHTRRCACILHGGNNPTALSWTVDSGLWRCHSCGAGGDRIALVRAVRQCSFREAVEFLAGIVGVEYHAGKLSRTEFERARQQREAELATARLLVDAEQTVLQETRETVWALNDLRRNVSRRLNELENGKPERWPGETDWAWEVLRFVYGAIARVDTAYCIAALSAPIERAAFALHPEQREAMIQAALEHGYVVDSNGYRFEVSL